MPGFGDAPRILVINRASLGDVVMSTAALRLMRSTWPRAHITIEVPAAFAGLMRTPELADAVIANKKLGSTVLRSLRKTWRALSYRFARYDICFLLDQRRNYARSIRRLSNIPARVCASHGLGGKRNGSAGEATHVIPVGSVWSSHVVDYYQDVVQGFCPYPLGTDQGARVPLPRQMPLIAEPGRATLPATPGKKRVAFCFAGSPSNLTRWPEENWLALLGMARAEGWYIYAAVPPKQKPLGGAAAGSGMDTFACEDIMECCALLREADLLIAVDTGQIHLAAAMGVPVLALGGPTIRGTWPYSPSGAVLAASPGCFTCPFIADCPTNKTNNRPHGPDFIPPCMRAITPDMAFARARAMLDDRRP
jgi:heptosyltransferase-2